MTCSQSSAAIERFKQNRIAATIPTPLATYLHIYAQATTACYIDYMEGAKILAKYLAPIDIKETTSVVPDILSSYELHELAKALIPHTTIPCDIYQIENAIYEYLTKPR